jgi:hypothetical protein
VSDRPVAWMIGASFAWWCAATALYGTDAHVATLLGTVGPLAVAIVTWRLAEQTYRRNPPALTGVMMTGFVGKMVFFGAYVVMVIKGLGQPAVPFGVSFTGSFIAVYLIEALALRRLFME